MTIELRPLAPFGVEVVGMRLWEAADANLVQELTQAWSAHGLLIFRRQALSEDELVAFSSQFGEAAIIVREDWQSQNRPEVTHISNMKNYHGRSIGGLGVGELDWHTDQSYMVQPATGSILYMVEMPKEAPTTYWANLQLAYAGL
ncbi:MAG: hypothetical protein HOI95_10780, partial [Chromatiales bacterium]|nr:hypothetical protein [Chromatiales bacterium]